MCKELISEAIETICHMDYSAYPGYSEEFLDAVNNIDMWNIINSENELTVEERKSKILIEFEKLKNLIIKMPEIHKEIKDGKAYNDILLLFGLEKPNLKMKDDFFFDKLIIITDTKKSYAKIEELPPINDKDK